MSTTITPNLNTVSLYLKEGTSDKEYHLEILGNEEDGFTVQYRYGKRGSTLRVGKKNKLPVDYQTARTLFDNILKDQTKQGYHSGQDGVAYQNSEDAGKKSGVLPQLLNPITEAQALALINDPNWFMQEKMDGERRLIRWKGKKAPVEGINRSGEIVALPEPIVEKVKKIGCALICDGEIIGENYYLFDLLSIGVHALTGETFDNRLSETDSWLGVEFNITNFVWVPAACNSANKKAMWDELKARKAEGVVFTHKDSKYTVGRPHSMGNRLKFKFVESATVRVKEINSHARSVQIEVVKDGAWVPVGNCTIYPNFEVPRVGAVIEVGYLNYNPDGSIYQPKYKGERTDVGEEACLHSKLVPKAPVNGQKEDN